jgi:hypothetical protein
MLNPCSRTDSETRSGSTNHVKLSLWKDGILGSRNNVCLRRETFPIEQSPVQSPLCTSDIGSCACSDLACKARRQTPFKSSQNLPKEAKDRQTTFRWKESSHGRMGVILFGGAQYSLPEQANLTLIFFPKIVGGGGRGRSPKFFSGHTPKKFSGHTYKHSTKFSRHKIQKCFYDISKFFRNLYVLPEFRSDFCPTVKNLGGGHVSPHAPPGPYAYDWILP